MSRPERRHLLSITDLERDELEDVLRNAEGFEEIGARPIKKVPTLRGRTVVNLFYENSTRTRVSFEIAAKRLSADVVNVAAAASSVAKGESLRDTARTLLAMGADAIVLRHPSAGAPDLLARSVDATVINAGDGAHEHPTQAALDLYTVRRRLGTLEGLRVGIVGDIAHSRVARSVTLGFRRMGASVTVVGPPTMIPLGVSALGCDVSHDLDAVLPTLDVLYLLRLQRERHMEALIPSEREFVALYGVDSRRVEALPDHAVILHPGPMNRGVEISWDAAESGRTLIVDQVSAGVAVRMSLLYHLLGQSPAAEVAS
ncbi:MAG TPA: aspartate carbamoyltransferase catalytic subunit [Actinomycetota bacterium]|nr:aspartate carbamoyltransferase catalytic subunit [Actinomycetota bacterium]